jgi:hypothetical protein
MRVAGGVPMKPLALVLLLLAAGCAMEDATRQPDPGNLEISVGRCPDYPTPCSRGIVLLNIEDRSVSVVDLPAGKEAARIPLPTGAWLTGLAVDDGGDRAFVVTADGQVFAIDLEALEMTRVFEDQRLYFSAAAWDAPRRRLLLAVGEKGQRRKEPPEQESIHALVEGRLVKLVSPPIGPQLMLARGDRLWCAGLAHCVLGAGIRASGLGVVDLATDTLLRHELFPEGGASDLALGPAGRLWAVNDDMGQLLGFTPDLDEGPVRNLFDFWVDESFEYPGQVEVDATRVLVSTTSSERVVVYERRDTFLSDHPVREYRLEDLGPLLGMCLLEDGRVAVTVMEKNAVIILNRRDAHPFTGFAR